MLRAALGLPLILLAATMGQRSLAGLGQRVRFWNVIAVIMRFGGVMLGLIGVPSIGAVIGVGLIFRAYLLAEAAFVAILEYTLLIFGALWGWVLWGQVLDLVAVLGIGLIICSGAVLVRTTR